MSMSTPEERRAMTGLLPSQEDGMTLELHDAEVGDSLNGKAKHIDYDYQAEMHVHNAYEAYPHIVLFILYDHLGERARWERQADGQIVFISKADRFRGEWQLNLAYPGK